MQYSTGSKFLTKLRNLLVAMLSEANQNIDVNNVEYPAACFSSELFENAYIAPFCLVSEEVFGAGYHPHHPSFFWGGWVLAVLAPVSTVYINT